MPQKRYDNKEAINFETRIIKLVFCDYSGAYILVTGNKYNSKCITWYRCCI